MNVPGLNISEIPPTRKTRKDTDLKQFIYADMVTFNKAAKDWVHHTARDARAMVLAAGNPEQHFVTIDGVTNANGTIRRAFHKGTIEESEFSVRIEFNAETLANIARGCTGILVSTIRATFPRSATGRLSHEWSWWVSREGGPSRRVGKVPPHDLGIGDVLYLAPDYGVAKYAWYALNNSRGGSSGAGFNLIQGRTTKKGKVIATRIRKTLRGYLARATAKMRAKRVPGVLFQGGFSRDYMSGRASKSDQGVPFVRVRFKGSLNRRVDV